MSVFEMLTKRKKKQPEQEQPKQQAPKYDKSYFEEKLAKYLVDADIVETVIPAFMELSKADVEGKLVDQVMDILEFKEQEIQGFYDNQDKFLQESEGDSNEETLEDNDNQEDQDYLMKVLEERYPQ